VGECFRYEIKTTEKDSVGVKIGFLVKIDREATEHGQVPVLVLSFAKMPDLVDRDWFMVPGRVWREMTGKKDGQDQS
jgi:hypothetical protein